MRPTLILLLLVFASTGSAAGQADGQADSVVMRLVEGQRVRVSTHANRERSIGTISRLDDDTLFLVTADSAALLAIARTDLWTVDVSRGEGNATTVGTVAGAAGGLAAGIFIYSANNRDCSPEDALCDLDNAGNFLVVPLLGLVGGVAGYAIGMLFKTERWERLSLEQLQMSYTPDRRLRLGFVGQLRL